MVAMQDRAGGDHLGVEQGVLGEQAQEEPAVTVGPVHHGGDGEAAGEWRQDCIKGHRRNLSGWG